jgi:hypothetical protein
MNARIAFSSRQTVRVQKVSPASLTIETERLPSAFLAWRRERNAYRKKAGK